VFAGGIDDWSQVTAWDEACGFEPDTDVLAARLREDEGALTCVGATGSRLPFLDQQYRDGTTDPTVEDLGQAIVAGVRAGGAQVAFIPLGLGHTDHRLTAAACLWAARHESDIEWFVYQDLPYAYEDDEAVEEALGGLGDVRPQPVRFPPPTDPTRKAEAIAFYRSQIMGLGEERIALALQPERYWRLTPGSATLHAQ
jgi:LmbE family N-acetylglucosaminyl deacetylase